MIWPLMLMSRAAGARMPGYSMGGSTRGGRSSVQQQQQGKKHKQHTTNHCVKESDESLLLGCVREQPNACCYPIMLVCSRV